METESRAPNPLECDPRAVADRIARGDDVSADELAGLLGPRKQSGSTTRLWIVVGIVMVLAGMVFVLWPSEQVGLLPRVLGILLASSGGRIATLSWRRASLRKSGVNR